MYIKRLGCECVDWINLAQYEEKRGDIVSAVMNNRMPYA